MFFKLSFVFIYFLLAINANAEVCDWRPSQHLGKGATATVGAGAGATAAAGIGLKAAGIYAITNATTGAAMLASTTAGASAAGTAGILAGTGGAIGVIGTALISPIVIIPAALVATGVGALEGGCYFVQKRNNENEIR